MKNESNDVIIPIKYIPMLRQNPKEKMTVKIEMIEPEKPVEDFGFVSMWEFENAK